MNENNFSKDSTDQKLSKKLSLITMKTAVVFHANVLKSCECGIV